MTAAAHAWAVVSLIIAMGCATPASNPDRSVTSTPYGGTPHAIPGLIEAEHFDDGGPGLAFHDVDSVNEGAAYRGMSHIDIEQRADASNGYGIGWTRAGEWLLYTVDVKTTGTYTIDMPVASQREGGVCHLDIEGNNVSGPIRIPDTKAWSNLQVLHVENVRLVKGIHVLRLVMDAEGPSGSIGDIDYLKFELQR